MSDMLNRYLCASDSYSGFLAHHGIKGQKWGVRRFQNPDGTRTEAGKKRYRTGKQKPMSEYSSEKVTNESLRSYKSQASQLSHVRVNKNTEGRIFSDHGNLIGMINTEKKDDGHTWIQGLELFGEGKGKGLSYQMLDYATKELGATHLSVSKSNTVAKHVYDKYGFETYSEDDNMAYMRLKSKR